MNTVETCPDTDVLLDLEIAVARQFALAVIPDFDDGIGDENAHSPPDITVLYCFLRLKGRDFVLLEYVAGETLKDLMNRSGCAACEAAIPLFCRLLDRRTASISCLKHDSLELIDFGIARANASVETKLYGSVMIRSDGHWCEEILGPGGSRSETYPLLLAVYAKLVGKLPGVVSLIPSEIENFSAKSLSRPLKQRWSPYLTAIGTAVLVLGTLFGMASFLAKTAASPSTSIPTRPASRGARLIRKTDVEYPPLAREERVSGIVRLEVTIGEDGKVRTPRVLSGHPLLLAGITDAVKKWIYEPALVNGKPAPVRTEIEIRFEPDP